MPGLVLDGNNGNAALGVTIDKITPSGKQTMELGSTVTTFLSPRYYFLDGPHLSGTNTLVIFTIEALGEVVLRSTESKCEYIVLCRSGACSIWCDPICCTCTVMCPGKSPQDLCVCVCVGIHYYHDTRNIRVPCSIEVALQVNYFLPAFRPLAFTYWKNVFESQQFHFACGDVFGAS